MFYKVWEFFQYTKKAHVSAFAAYAVYFTMLSIFPMLMVFLSIIEHLPISAKDLLDIVNSILPYQLEGIAESIILDLESKTSTTNTAILSISAFSTLWASAKGIHGLYRGINSVYNVTKERNYFFRMLLCIFYTFFFMIVVVLMLLLIVFGNQIQSLLLIRIPTLQSSSRILAFLRSLISIALMMCFFIALYKFVPLKKVHMVAQIPGALFSTVCWTVLSFGFSFFVDHFGNYADMYGSLTAIILVMLWLYLGMNIILYGGAINYWLDEHENIYI